MESCLLCLELQCESLNSVKVNSTQWEELQIEYLIVKHFWPMQTLKLSTLLCGPCWKQLHDFHEFYTRIENAHTNFDSLLKIEISPPTFMPIEETVVPELIATEPITVIKEEYIVNEVTLPEVPTVITKNIDEIAIRDPLKKPKPRQIKQLKSTKAKTKKKAIEKRKEKVRKERAQKVKQRGKKQTIKKLKQKPVLILEDEDTNSDSIYDSSDNEHDQKPKLNRTIINKNIDDFIAKNFELKCNVCELPMETFAALCKHVATDHNNERPYATCCNRQFLRRCQLNDHIKQHLDPDFLKCKDCGKVCQSRSSLRSHMKVHDEKREKNHCCDVCGISFYTLRTLNTHKTRHLKADEKMFTCSKCGKKFGNSVTLQNHMRIVHGPPISCDICGLVVINKPTVILHKKLKHPEVVQELKCPICPKVLTNQIAYDRHIRYTHNCNYLKCPKCVRTFKTPEALERHVETHTTDDPLFACPLCKKKFVDTSKLAKHRKKWHPKEYEEYIRKKYGGNLPPTFKKPTTKFAEDDDEMNDF